MDEQFLDAIVSFVMAVHIMNRPYLTNIWIKLNGISEVDEATLD